MRLRILFHDNCFDGAAAAALFAAFYRERIDADAEIAYVGLQHKSGDPFPPDAFSGDVNACVDFRYSAAPGLAWWFDHHVSAFVAPADRLHFSADASGRKFYDPAARSCTKFEAGVLADRFGFAIDRFRELIDWADVIDGAQFSDAATAVTLAAPALRLMTWIEHNKDHALGVRYIEDLQRRSMTEIAASAWITRPLEPILERHRWSIDVIRRRAIEEGGVVFFDLTEDGIEAHNKFIAYMLHPTCRYTVGVTRSSSRAKVSVGFNPWSANARTHDIARICERYGGGGHPVVGAVSLPPGDVARAKEIAREIAAELRGQTGATSAP